MPIMRYLLAAAVSPIVGLAYISATAQIVAAEAALKGGAITQDDYNKQVREADTLRKSAKGLLGKALGSPERDSNSQPTG